MNRVPLPGAVINYDPAPGWNENADQLFRALQSEIPWDQRHIKIQGRLIPEPRLTSWHGDPGASYGYSGIKLETKPWTPTLLAIRNRVEELTRAKFNSVLLNLYQDGRSSIGAHADDEPELGPNPTIASVSLGATRTFRLVRKGNSQQSYNLPLASGSLLVMAGETQKNWLHSVPKTQTPVGSRINLTFRLIRP